MWQSVGISDSVNYNRLIWLGNSSSRIVVDVVYVCRNTNEAYRDDTNVVDVRRLSNLSWGEWIVVEL